MEENIAMSSILDEHNKCSQKSQFLIVLLCNTEDFIYREIANKRMIPKCKDKNRCTLTADQFCYTITTWFLGTSVSTRINPCVIHSIQKMSTH